MDLRTRAIAVCAALWWVQAVPHAQHARHPEPAKEPREAVLIQGSNLDAVIEAVCAAGGEVTHQLGIINAVGAQMTRIQLCELEANNDTLRIRADRMANVDSRPAVAANEHTPNEQATDGPCPPRDADTANDLTPSPRP